MVHAMSRRSGRHRIMGSLPDGSPRDDGFRIGLNMILTYTSESTVARSLVVQADDDLNWRSHTLSMEEEGEVGGRGRGICMI